MNKPKHGIAKQTIDRKSYIYDYMGVHFDFALRTDIFTEMEAALAIADAFKADVEKDIQALKEKKAAEKK